jgi:hypothetical protein
VGPVLHPPEVYGEVRPDMNQCDNDSPGCSSRAFGGREAGGCRGRCTAGSQKRLATSREPSTPYLATLIDLQAFVGSTVY